MTSLPRRTRDCSKRSSVLKVDDTDLAPCASSPQFSDSEARIENGSAHGTPHEPSPSPSAIQFTSMHSMKTPAEKIREKSLLDDPLTIVLGPACVQCKLCQKKIKLSDKSAFDTFHWRNHRARCLRTRKTEAKAQRPASGTPVPSTPSPELAPKIIDTPTSPRLPRADLQDMPPLVHSESEKVLYYEPSVEIQSSAQLTTTTPPTLALYPAHVTPFIPSPDRPINDCMLRSHPECTQTCMAIALGDHGRNWTWKQLKQPRFALPVYYDDDDDGSGDDHDAEDLSIRRAQFFDAVDPEQEQDAIRVLCQFYQSR